MTYVMGMQEGQICVIKVEDKKLSISSQSYVLYIQAYVNYLAGYRGYIVYIKKILEVCYTQVGAHPFPSGNFSN